MVQRSSPHRGSQCPGAILGIMNLRGKVLTVFDLDSLLGLPSTAEKERSQVRDLESSRSGDRSRLSGGSGSQIREVSSDQSARTLRIQRLGEGKGVFFRGALYLWRS